MTDLHSAVRTAVDEARRLAQAATVEHETKTVAAFGGSWGESIEDWIGPLDEPIAVFIAAWPPARALAMCDWADDVLARHRGEDRCECGELLCSEHEHAMWPCREVVLVAAAFGVETGETP